MRLLLSICLCIFSSSLFAEPEYYSEDSIFIEDKHSIGHIHKSNYPSIVPGPSEIQRKPQFPSQETLLDQYKEKQALPELSEEQYALLLAHLYDYKELHLFDNAMKNPKRKMLWQDLILRPLLRDLNTIETLKKEKEALVKANDSSEDQKKLIKEIELIITNIHVTQLMRYRKQMRQHYALDRTPQPGDIVKYEMDSDGIYQGVVYSGPKQKPQGLHRYRLNSVSTYYGVSESEPRRSQLNTEKLFKESEGFTGETNSEYEDRFKE